jgi:ABC-type spermidine/putrescine transport system permease subunit II
MDGSVSASGQIAAAPAPGRADASYGAPDDPIWRWLTLSPALMMMLLLSVLPLANLFLTSFYSVSWSGGRAVWLPAGLANYAALARDDLLRAGITNTLIFAVFAVGGQMLLGFILALLCVRVTSGRVLYRTIFILPILIPGIVVGAMWKLLLNFDFGLINQLVGLAGFDPVNWLGAKETALASVILVDIWHWTPFCFLVLLAALQGGVPGGGRPAFEVRLHKLYNPEGVTQRNIVPGLMGVILSMTMVMMTGLAMTRERERGTMENLLATPVLPLEVMLGNQPGVQADVDSEFLRR